MGEGEAEADIEALVQGFITFVEDVRTQTYGLHELYAEDAARHIRGDLASALGETGGNPASLLDDLRQLEKSSPHARLIRVFGAGDDETALKTAFAHIAREAGTFHARLVTAVPRIEPNTDREIMSKLVANQSYEITTGTKVFGSI